MLALWLALTASVSWGAADFLGGAKSRVVPLLTVVAISQLAGLALVAAVALPTHSLPDLRTALYGALAATAGLIAVAAFYRGMAIGTISVIAPVSATGVALPVTVGLARGERPGTLALIGIVLALVGVVLASAESDSVGQRSIAAGVPIALAAAFGFGVFFLALAKASEGHQALAASFVLRLTTAPLIVLALIAFRRPLTVARSQLHWLILVGVLDSGANVLFALATNRGLLSVISVVGSLYPVTTVVLAQTLLREHVGAHQRLGVVTALAGVALISGG